MEARQLFQSIRSISIASSTLTFQHAGQIAHSMVLLSINKTVTCTEYDVIEILLQLALENLKDGNQGANNICTVHRTIAAALHIALQNIIPSELSTDEIVQKYVLQVLHVAYLPLIQGTETFVVHGNNEDVLSATVSLLSRSHQWSIALEMLKSSVLSNNYNSDSFSSGMIRLGAKILDAAAAALKPHHGTHTSLPASSSSSPVDDADIDSIDAVLEYGAHVLFPQALHILTRTESQPSEYRKKNNSRTQTTPLAMLIGQYLLPSALTAAKTSGELSSCLDHLWHICTSPDSGLDQRIRLTLLVQFCQPLVFEYGSDHSYKDPDLKTIILHALSSENDLDRKRGLHIWENVISRLQEDDTNDACLVAWATFIKLYATVDDSSVHLFKEAWPEIENIHARHVDGAESVISLPFEWILLLWTRAFQHKHIKVQKIVLLSFLQRAWPPTIVSQLPTDFASKVLMPVLGDNSVQRGECSEEIWNEVPAFFEKWGDLHLLLELVQILSGENRQLSMVKALCIVLPATARGAALKGGLTGDQQIQLLEAIIPAAAAQPAFGSNALTIKAYESLISVMEQCVEVDNADVMLLVAGVCTAVPLPLIRPQGLLHDALIHWLKTKNNFKINSKTRILKHLVDNYVEGQIEGLTSGAERQAKAVTVAALLISETATTADKAQQMLRDSFESLDSAVSAFIMKANTLHFLQALLSTTKNLPGNTASSNYDDFVFRCFKNDTWKNRLIHTAEMGIDWLIELAQPESIAKLSSTIDKNCTRNDIRPEDAFYTDKVLSKTFMEARNAACNALQLAAEAGYVGCAENFMRKFTYWYPPLFDASCFQPLPENKNNDDDGDVEATMRSMLVQRRCRLEVAISFLHPLPPCASCCSADSVDSTEKHSTEDFLLALMRGMVGFDSVENKSNAVGNTNRNTNGTAEHSDQKKKRSSKKKHSLKLEKLSMNSWRTLLTWRSIDAELLKHAERCSEGLQGQLLAAAVSSLAAAPVGSTAVLQFIRCIRRLLPSLIGSDQTRTAFCNASNINSDVVNDAVDCICQVLLSALIVHVRKRTGMTAAVLSCCLHPCLFNSQAVHELHSHDSNGAVRRAVLQLKQTGDRYTRLLPMFSSQFGALLAAFPELGTYYIDVVTDLALSGFDDEVNAVLAALNDVVIDEPSAKEVAALLDPIDAELARAYASSYAAPRVGMLYLFHSWVREGCSIAKQVWDRLLHIATHDPEMSCQRYVHGGFTHRRKIRLWQALAILSPAVDINVASTLEILLDTLDRSNAASVKQFQEMTALQMVYKQPDLLEYMILPRISDYVDQRNEALPSLACIAAVAAIKRSQEQDLIRRVITAIIPWAGSFVHANRTFSQLILWRMGELNPWVGREDPSFGAMMTFFSNNVDLARLRAAMGVEFGLEKFILEDVITPSSILSENSPSSLLGMGSNPSGGIGILEAAPTPLLELIGNYLNEEREVVRSTTQNMLTESALEDDRRRDEKIWKTFEEMGIHGDHASRGEAYNKDTTASGWCSTKHASSTSYQRKITPSDKESIVTDPWGAALGLSLLCSNEGSNRMTTSTGTIENNGEIFDEFEAGALHHAADEAIANAVRDKESRQELVVVASLLDKIPNLAGLARTCEIFRASKLVLQDASVVNDHQFSRISVSAQHWVPIEEVKPLVLESWLKQKAALGYTLVGLEQTVDSTSLPEYEFPRKTVLVLGAEKEGVPAHLLQLLHATVEIPQMGVVRSLNVHVSAAITIYEFTRQRLLKSRSLRVVD